MKLKYTETNLKNILGGGGVGKSNITLRFINGTFEVGLRKFDN